MLHNFHLTFKNHSPRLWQWFWLWSIVNLFLILSRVIAFDWQAVPFLILQWVFWIIISWIYIPWHWLSPLLLSLSLVFSMGGFAQRWFLANSWRTPTNTKNKEHIEQVGLTNQGAISAFTGTGERKAGIRNWRLDLGTGAVELKFEARLVEGVVGWSWFGDAINLEPLQEDGRTLTRWNTPH